MSAHYNTDANIAIEYCHVLLHIAMYCLLLSCIVTSIQYLTIQNEILFCIVLSIEATHNSIVMNCVAIYNIEQYKLKYCCILLRVVMYCLSYYNNTL